MTSPNARRTTVFPSYEPGMRDRIEKRFDAVRQNHPTDEVIAVMASLIESHPGLPSVELLSLLSSLMRCGVRDGLLEWLHAATGSAPLILLLKVLDTSALLQVGDAWASLFDEDTRSEDMAWFLTTAYPAKELVITGFCEGMSTSDMSSLASMCHRLVDNRGGSFSLNWMVADSPETHAILLDVGARVGLPESASYWFRKPSTPSPVGIDEINWRIIPPMGLVLGSGLEPETANLLIDALHAREDDNRAFVGVIPAPLNEFMRKMRAQESMKDSLPLLRTGIRVMAIAHTVRLDEEQEAMLADDWDMPDDFLTQRWKLENAPDPKKPYMWREMEAYLDAALATDRLDWVVPPPWTEG